ncbi:MAG: zf-HC2 domain-containing protein [Sulfuritalea sp.]|nr:zf-HC2 domain-containing protein [Sulfuritalea sp.]
MLSCKEATHVMSAAHERELGLRERIALRLHLLMCRGCRNYERQMDFLRRACGRVGTSTADDKASGD